MSSTTEQPSRNNGIAAHTLTIAEAAQALATNPEEGLNRSEVQQRLAQDGPNILRAEESVTWWRTVIRQFTSALIAVLIIAGIVSLVVEEFTDAIVIFAIVILNGALGAFQELRAERALEALMRSVAPTTTVIREGIQQEIPAADLTRGDLVTLNSGDLVPADLRLVEAHSLSVDESPLTGESAPVEKSPDNVLADNAALGDRTNCAYMGASIAYGRGAGIVFAIGMNTQLGQIAEVVSSQERSQTPLQKKLDILGKQLGLLALVLCGVIFVTGLLRDEDLLEIFLVAVSLAVAAIPEGLPAVVTIALALGVQRMLKRHALVRRLAAVETLGAATVICTDKTGTLTYGEMTVEQIYQAGQYYPLTNGGIEQDGNSAPSTDDSPLSAMLRAMILCNDAALERANDGTTHLAGSPTEVALARAAQENGFEEAERERYPRIAEAPFDSRRKRMSTAHRTPEGQILVFTKGAPEVALPFCKRIVTAEGVTELNDEARAEIDRTLDEMASQAYRLLALAYREDNNLTEEATPEQLERDLTFLGLAGLMDPPRPETPAAVAECARAGIRTIMVTGDHAQTATAIARSVGIVADKETKHLTGPEVDGMSQEELTKALKDTSVFARVAPSHKMRIVEALQSQGEVVAMTGDGSNDAPALKKADIGVAMGIRGTDVSKEAADMVLTDDNFQSIVAAAHEGRIIYSNIRKVVMYLLSCNLGEIVAVFVAMVSGQPLILQPIQILWVNLVTDGLPALALSTEGEETGVMEQPPRNPREGVITGRTLYHLMIQGLLVGGVTLAAFFISQEMFPGDLIRTQTSAFITLALSQLILSFSFRTERVSVFRQGLTSNRWILGAMLLSAALLFAVVYLPFAQEWFHIETPGLQEWSYILPLSLLPFVAAETTKFILARRSHRSTPAPQTA